MKVIPIMASAGISGFESPASEYSDLGLSIEDLILKNPNATFIGQATGTSMIGVGIFDKDILVVDRAVERKNHDVIVCTYNGEFACKILDVDNRLLISANESIPPIRINELDSFRIEGTVICSLRCHRPCYLPGE
ncbi:MULTISPECIES: LexA family protein [Vibrio harveyi group]|uniref:DNA polymerase V n=1 Tax=Vibrio owensii CAIM 1854 = LMG 25443 TaxID=1229493 RepID=A0A0C1ZIT1_9VIBR|nr:S24 family peptidase [Vibrio owensii]KIF53131.1 DNA polymerase V [Vibrio owensii CAIM 1854 = LMG 25443]